MIVSRIGRIWPHRGAPEGPYDRCASILSTVRPSGRMAGTPNPRTPRPTTETDARAAQNSRGPPPGRNQLQERGLRRQTHPPHGGNPHPDISPGRSAKSLAVAVCGSSLSVAGIQCLLSP